MESKVLCFIQEYFSWRNEKYTF